MWINAYTSFSSSCETDEPNVHILKCCRILFIQPVLRSLLIFLRPFPLGPHNNRDRGLVGLAK
ncbi:hypothetical protein E2C01_009625 [Portunus trituberculatus]|uniref:Uncharacterized protein n=1 Tax=Portunus trituberculatus TaxID=210409 RepID=A0A5B7D699_PORTR|nr:hypothetical protein [Portunus trituberculatus]